MSREVRGARAWRTAPAVLLLGMAAASCGGGSADDPVDAGTEAAPSPSSSPPTAPVVVSTSAPAPASAPASATAPTTAEPTEPAEGDGLDGLLGRTWTVVATTDDGQARRTPHGLRRPTLTVGADGVARLFTGCNAGRTIVRVQGGTLVFGPTTSTRRACPEPERTIERRVLAVLDGPADSVQQQGQVLIVTRGSGRLVLSVR